MRIIAGEYRSRRLSPPPAGARTRPMPDRVRESLFGHLRGRTEGAVVLDAFAGTGAVGLEAVSRGAAECLFVERDRRAAGALKRNIEALGCGDRCRVFVGDALSSAVLHRCAGELDLAFFDPPYEMVEDPRRWPLVVAQLGRVVERLSADGFLVLRTPWPFRHRVGAGGAGGGGGGWDEGGEDADGAAGVRGGEAVEVDLSVEGAVGPETHVYRHTAVHLYGRGI